MWVKMWGSGLTHTVTHTRKGKMCIRDRAMSILLQSLNVSEEVLRQERAKSIAAVKRTNGQLRLEQKLRELESESWQG